MSYIQGLLPQIGSCVDEHILLDMFLSGVVYSNSSQTMGVCVWRGDGDRP